MAIKKSTAVKTVIENVLTVVPEKRRPGRPRKIKDTSGIVVTPVAVSDITTQDQVQKLFDEKPLLFETVLKKFDVLKYPSDIFDKYPSVLKGQFLDRKESVIPENEGRSFTFIIDNQTFRIGMQQRKMLGLTLPELFRHAIWTYLEVLTAPSFFDGNIEKPKFTKSDDRK